MSASIVNQSNGFSNTQFAARPKPAPSFEHRKPNSRRRRSVAVTHVKHAPSASNTSTTSDTLHSMLRNAQLASAARACSSARSVSNTYLWMLFLKVRYTTVFTQHKTFTCGAAGAIRVKFAASSSGPKHFRAMTLGASLAVTSTAMSATKTYHARLSPAANCIT